jgi:hypothetical protein
MATVPDYNTSRARRGAGVVVPAALAAASSASLSLFRRANASTGVSPTRIRLVATFKGVFPGDSALGEAAAGVPAAEAAGEDTTSGRDGTAGAVASGTTKHGLNRALRFRAGFWQSSRSNQSRSDSSEMRTSRPRSPIASASTEAPPRRRRSTSSRCGARSCFMDRRGQRACATKSANVGGNLGRTSGGDGGEVGVMWEQYSDRGGCAMGAVWVRSKPTGLDVGVLCHGFLWVRLKKCSKSRLMPLVGFFGRWFVEGWSMVGRRWDDGFRSEWCTFLRFDLMRERFGTWLGSESFLALGVTRLVRGGAC